MVTLLPTGCDVIAQMLLFHGSENLMEITVIFLLNIIFFFVLGQTLGDFWKIELLAVSKEYRFL